MTRIRLTRRILLAFLGVTLVAQNAPAWAGHGAGRSLVTISPESLMKLIESRRAPILLVDLRPTLDYRRGRLPGAISMSGDEISRRIVDVSPMNVVVLYCACPVDEVAPLYERLRNTGHRNLLVLQGGFAGWEARGYPVEQ